jgi:predicted adenylyl cyclase CyaB
MNNIEVKTPLDDPAVVEAAVLALGARFRWERVQRDTFYRVPEGYLKLREVEGASAELIAYLRGPGTEPRSSDYDIARVPADAAMLRRVLERSLGVRGVIRKTRRLFLWRHTRIHLDTVENLGTFLELETVIDGVSETEARAEAEAAIEALGLDRARFLDRPYLELLETQGGSPCAP